jgi:hypothetical protein
MVHNNPTQKVRYSCPHSDCKSDRTLSPEGTCPGCGRWADAENRYFEEEIGPWFEEQSESEEEDSSGAENEGGTSGHPRSDEGDHESTLVEGSCGGVGDGTQLSDTDDNDDDYDDDDDEDDADDTDDDNESEAGQGGKRPSARDGQHNVEQMGYQNLFLL